MSTSLKNGTMTLGGTAQDALPARLGRSQLTFSAQDEDTWVNFGENAAIDDGHLVLGGTSMSWTVWKFPEIGGRVSIISPTTGAKYEITDV